LGALVVPAALAVGLSSCSTVPARAATVNGTAISRSDFERDLKALAANPGLLNLTGGTDVSIDATTARGWLSQIITWKTAEDLLNEQPGLESPTLEHLCQWFAARLAPAFPGLSRIAVSRPTVGESCALNLV